MSCTKLHLPPEHLISGLLPPDPRSLCPQLNLLNPPHLRTKFLGTPLPLTVSRRLAVDRSRRVQRESHT